MSLNGKDLEWLIDRLYERGQMTPQIESTLYDFGQARLKGFQPSRFDRYMSKKRVEYEVCGIHSRGVAASDSPIEPAS